MNEMMEDSEEEECYYVYFIAINYVLSVSVQV